MPTMVNPRSLALENANPRLLTAPNADVLLGSSTPFFHVNNSGIPSTNIITFNAILIAMEGTVTFSCVGGTLSNIVGNTCALNYETMTGDSATVKATITFRNKEYSDTVEISKLYDGQNGVVGMNNAVVYAYQRSATQPTGTPGAVEYSFPAAGITTATLANGWQKTIPAGVNPLWVTAASASASSSLDNIAANEWSSPVILAQNGLDGVSPALLDLSCNAQTFTYNSAGVAVPANQLITFTAELVNATGTATFTCTKYDSSGASLGTVTLGGTGNTRTLSDTQFTTGAFRAVVTATMGALSDTVTIVRLADGAAGTGVSALAGYLTNESVTVPSASDGSSPVLTNAKGNFKVFQGTTDVTASCTFAVVGSTAVNTVAPTSGAGAYSVTGIGTWASASMTTSVTYRATHTPSGATIDQVFILTKAPAGSAGPNSAVVTIYRRTTTTATPALPSVATTYTFSPAGLVGLDNSWTTTLPPASNGKYLWASTATAVSTTPTDNIPATEWAAAQMLVQDGAAGSRGNVQVARAIPGSVWSDSEAVLAISGAGYGVPQSRDIVTLYNNTASYSQQKYYDGAAWQVLAAYLPGGVIVDGTVDATALKAETITGDKIKAGAITASKLAVTSSGNALNRDPNFTDLAGSWTTSGGLVYGTAPGGGNVPANTYVYSPAGAAATAITKEMLAIDPTKTYILAGAVYTDGTNNRLCAFTIDFYDSANVKIASSGWGDANYSGLVNTFTPVGGQWTPYRSGMFGAKVIGKAIPSNARTCRIGLYLNAGGSSNTLMACTALRLEEAVGTTLIEPGAITADKISVVSLSAINVDVGFLTSRAGGPGAGYGPGTEIQKDQIRIYDEGGNLRCLDGRLN